MDIQKFISPLIASQFPAFYQEEGPNFIRFVEAYYEWMEQSTGAIHLSRSLTEFTDIDKTLPEFVTFFKKTYIQSLPESIIADKQLLVKHILDLYRSKGTRKAYELLFRIMFNEDIDIYIPGEHMFKASEAKWYVPQYIEVSDCPYLNNFIGKEIRTASGKAVVENSFSKVVNNKVVNVLMISKLLGEMKFGQQVFCDGLFINTITGEIVDGYTLGDFSTNYTPLITFDNAPEIFGSLSAIGIINGGINFQVGDLLKVKGGGKDAIAKVSSVARQSGKVTFKLVDGGHGFTRNPSIEVTGGSGTGAHFEVGDISDIAIYEINTDRINDYYNAEFDIDGSGFNINIDSRTGSFIEGETLVSSANVITFDVKIVAGLIANGEVLSNSSLGISNLYAYHSDGSYLAVTHPIGDETPILNANLVTGAILVNGTGGSVQINTPFPKQTITANAEIVTANSSVIYIDNITSSVNGSDPAYVFPYVLDKIVPGRLVTGLTSGVTANVVSVDRLTTWEFPNAVDISNLDFPNIGSILRVVDLEVGTITYLTAINPGFGYSTPPTIEIVEPLIYDLKIKNKTGGYYGYDAIVTATAGNANGVVTSVEIINSGFAYNPDETVYLTNANNFSASVIGVAIVDTQGVGSGRWSDNIGFASDEIYLQDSYYYQTFSYEIVAKRMINTYEKFVRDLIHPSGIALFGKFINKNELITESSKIMYNQITQE